jgi:hypothetical protein
MSDHRSRQKPDGLPEAELEATELRRRHVEEFRQERERRTADSPSHAGPDVSWKPPAELAARKSRRPLPRVVAFLLLLAGVYVAVRVATERLFTPELQLLGAAVPSQPVEPNQSVTVGVYARNERPREGAAYALLIMQDGSEVEGPVVPVPQGDSVLVPVQATFSPGDHVTSLVLFDAWRENVEVGAVHGVVIRSGVLQVEVEGATLGPVASPSDSVVVSFQLANRSGFAASVVPVVVFTPASGGGQPTEVALPVARVPSNGALPVRQSIAPGVVPPGRYLVAVLSMTGAGEPTGTGVHGLPLVLPAQATPDR